jgi:hypothetical protein
MAGVFLAAPRPRWASRVIGSDHNKANGVTNQKKAFGQIYNRETNCDSETLNPFAISSRFRIERFLFPRSTSARKLRSIPTRSAITT